MIGKTKDNNINDFGQLRLIKVDKIHAPTTDINYDDNKLNPLYLILMVDNAKCISFLNLQ